MVSEISHLTTFLKLQKDPPIPSDKYKYINLNLLRDIASFSSFSLLWKYLNSVDLRKVMQTVEHLGISIYVTQFKTEQIENKIISF